MGDTDSEADEVPLAEPDSRPNSPHAVPDHSPSPRMDLLVQEALKAEATPARRDDMRPGPAGDAAPLRPPRGFCCPITSAVMTDPVIASDGHTYERHAFEQWLTANTTSPTTGEKLRTTTLTPNTSLQCLIEEWRKRNVYVSKISG